MRPANFRDIQMYLIRRLTPYLILAVSLTGFELIFLLPNFLPYICFGILAIFVFIWHQFTRLKAVEQLNFILTPLLFFSSAILICLFLESNFLRQLIAAAVSLISYFYFANLYDYFYQTSRYQVNSLQLISEYVNLLAAFFFYTGFFSFRIFLNYPVSPLILGVVIISFLLIYASIWIHKVNFGQNLIYSGIGSLVLAQIFLAISFLPNSFYVNGMALAAIFYVYVNLALLYLTSHAHPRKIAKYIVISALSILLVYVTASWT